MNLITLKVPITIANVGISMKYIDKPSLFSAINNFNDKLNSSAADIETISNLPIHSQYMITSLDMVNEVAEIAITQELFQELATAGVTNGLSIAYACSLSPMVLMPLWHVNDVSHVMLSVSIQARAEDFIYDNSDVKEEL